jgi:geranyl-CoA carboxylase beta subunit
VLQSLQRNEQLALPIKKPSTAPLYKSEELLGLIPSKSKKAYDVREVIARLVDRSDFQDFKPEFDSQTVCGFAYIDGHSVGIIGNNGPITAKGANKAAQFIQLCEQGQRSLFFCIILPVSWSVLNLKEMALSNMVQSLFKPLPIRPWQKYQY